MSSRALRRAQKGNDLESLAVSENEDEIVELKPRQNNLFQHFALLDEEDIETEEEANNSDSQNEVIDSNEPFEDIIEETKPAHKTKSKKNKQKKIDSTKSEEDFDEFFEKNAEKFQTLNHIESRESDPFIEALKVDPNWLDANTELKKKFGGSVSGGNSVLGEINSHVYRNNPALNRNLKRKPYKRKNGFITPRSTWPPFGPAETGLSVNLVRTDSGLKEYEIFESPEYQSIFEELEILVRTGDFEFLMQLIHGNPLFVDGLLLLSDAYRMQSTGDAGEIVERALYILERILPSDLSLIDGNVRFRYSIPGNRKLHLCLFRQLQFTMKKGCWKVSLQLAKTLLSLDPETDPLGARLFLDFLCIQSESFEDFDKLWLQLKNNCLLSPLPGWIFNRSLKMFLAEEESKSDHSASTEALVEAIKTSPGTARLLLSTLKSKIPENFPNCDFFEYDLSQLGAAKIFVNRCQTLWKSPSVQKWLETCSSSCTNSGGENSLLDFRVVPNSYQVAVYRHSLLSDLPSLNIAIPSTISSTSSLNAYDPLPPESFDEESEGLQKSIISGLRDLLLGSFSSRA